MVSQLPAIPAKRYFTIGEVAELCDVKPHVLRYWEQEFTQLKPMKRRGNRRYYQHHEVLMIRRIRELLYEQGFTISGARNRLRETGSFAQASRHADVALSNTAQALPGDLSSLEADGALADFLQSPLSGTSPALGPDGIKAELLQIRALLSL